MAPVLLAGNWKMNGNIALINQWIDWALDGQKNQLHVDWLLFSPAPYLSLCAQRLNGGPIGWGAQDVSEHAEGAFTGQVSASMLSDVHCPHVLIGHSERRHGLGEGDETLQAKCQQALIAGLGVTFCVGETLEQRQSGQSLSVVLSQLDVLRPLLKDNAVFAETLSVAYEPVWAIGTGLHADADEIAHMHQAIRSSLCEMMGGESLVRLLYGGSVKPANARGIIEVDAVDGFLVGGASLNRDFIKIGEICSNLF